jgi:hypothetical protein
MMARPERFELPTPWFVARYSIQLSYGRVERIVCLTADSNVARTRRGGAILPQPASE